MQGGIFRQGRYDLEKFFQAGVLVEAKAGYGRHVVRGLFNEHTIEAVDKAVIAMDVQVVTKRTADERSLSAGNTEAFSGPAGSPGLMYVLRHTTDEVFSIAVVADEVSESSPEADD